MSMGNRPSFSREAKLQWAGSREKNLASGRGRTFFLTSLFIELIEGHSALSRVNECNRRVFSSALTRRGLLPVCRESWS